MARNRKNQPAAVRFGPAVRAFLLCLFIGGSGVGYVWQKNQIHDLGRQIKEREKRFERLWQYNKNLSDRYSLLCSPRALETQANKWGLGLVMPAPEQIVRLVEAPAGAAPTGLVQNLAEQRHHAESTP